MPTNPERRKALRLLVVVLQDVLRSGPFVEYADLTETMKCRCARLRIPYSSDLIFAAIDQLERGGRRPLVRTEAAWTAK